MIVEIQLNTITAIETIRDPDHADDNLNDCQNPLVKLRFAQKGRVSH